MRGPTPVTAEPPGSEDPSGVRRSVEGLFDTCVARNCKWGREVCHGHGIVSSVDAHAGREAHVGVVDVLAVGDEETALHPTTRQPDSSQVVRRSSLQAMHLLRHMPVGYGTRQRPDTPDSVSPSRSRCRVCRVGGGFASRQPSAPLVPAVLQLAAPDAAVSACRVNGQGAHARDEPVSRQAADRAAGRLRAKGKRLCGGPLSRCGPKGGDVPGGKDRHGVKRSWPASPPWRGHPARIL